MMCVLGVISLQYADDTIMFVDSDHALATNLKWLLTCFEQVSGMRINYDKSELIRMNIEPLDIETLANIFGCPIGAFPIKCIEIPLHFEKLSRSDL